MGELKRTGQELKKKIECRLYLLKEKSTAFASDAGLKRL
jgi:hypothetical protein